MAMQASSLISTAHALATLAVGQWGHRFPQHRLLLAAAWLMAATGLLYLAILTAFGTDLVARAVLSG